MSRIAVLCLIPLIALTACGKSREQQLREWTQTNAEAEKKLQSERENERNSSLNEFDATAVAKTLTRDPAKKLGSGATYYTYQLADDENVGQSVSVGLMSSAANARSIDNLAVEWSGPSTLRVARLTPPKLLLLVELAKAVFPDLDTDVLMDVVRTEGTTNYDGGSNVYRRQAIGTKYVAAAGVTGSSLIVKIVKIEMSGR